MVCYFRLGLIGYGVRVHDKVLDHTNPKVACEILDLTADMTTCCLMSDDIDEVSEVNDHLAYIVDIHYS